MHECCHTGSTGMLSEALGNDVVAITGAIERRRSTRSVADARFATVDGGCNTRIFRGAVAAPGGARSDVILTVEALFIAGTDRIAVERGIDWLAGPSKEDEGSREDKAESRS